MDGAAPGDHDTMRRALKRLFRFYWGEGIADDVPALAYYLLLSIAPFALGVAAVTLRLDDALTALSVAAQINRFLPEEIHPDIERLVVGTRDSSPQLLVVAVVAMLWTTSGAIGVIERCLSRMLDLPRHNIVTGRLRNMGLGAMVAAAVIFATVATSALNDLSDALSLRGTVPPGVLLVLAAVGSVLVFATIFRYAPRCRLRWTACLLGALPAGVGLQVVPTVVSLYVDAVAGLQAVRLFLVLAVVLLGLTLVAILVLVGAGIAASTERAARAAARRSRPQPVAATSPAAEPEGAALRPPSGPAQVPSGSGGRAVRPGA
jgi:membrane protein